MIVLLLTLFVVVVQRIIRYVELIFTGHVNWAAVVTSIVCILILLVIDYLNRFLHKKVRKIPIHIPAQLIVVCDYIGGGGHVMVM